MPSDDLSVTATWAVASGVSTPGMPGVSGPMRCPDSMTLARRPTTRTRSERVSARPGAGVRFLLPRLTASTVTRPSRSDSRSPTVLPSAVVTR